jgi:phospholipid transport system substrate-binding protein
MRTRQPKFFSGLASGFLLILLLGSIPVAAEEQELAEPQKVIEEISLQLADILEHERETLKNDPGYVYRLANKVLVPNVDFQRVSRLVLGKHFRSASSAQQQAFKQQFQRLLVRTYSTAFIQLDGDWEIRYLPLRTNKKGDVLVRTKVLYAGGAPLNIIYRMHLKDGSWKVYDVKIEGVSLVTNYRSSFANELRRTGIDGLIKKMSELNDRREKKKQLARVPHQDEAILPAALKISR